VSELPFLRERPDAKVATPLSYWDLRAFDDVLDARSPAEFAEDHIPDAVNVPVLDDQERALVGTVYKQQSAFDAKRAGAPIVSRNIARHIETLFAQMPRTWKPLVYCWRGGGRSGSLAHVLRQVGWDARRLDGGYKAFRRQVVATSTRFPGFDSASCAGRRARARAASGGPRGSGPRARLEVLAAHRGSASATCPTPQPSQKAFETTSGARSRSSTRRGRCS
jgi:tRNA 2-selenouridine synthase